MAHDKIFGICKNKCKVELPITHILKFNVLDTSIGEGKISLNGEVIHKTYWLRHKVTFDDVTDYTEWTVTGNINSTLKNLFGKINYQFALVKDENTGDMCVYMFVDQYGEMTRDFTNEFLNGKLIVKAILTKDV